jgi:hypothetical protein
MFNGKDFDYNQHAQDLDRPDLCCVPYREKGAFTPPEDTNSAETGGLHLPITARTNLRNDRTER